MSGPFGRNASLAPLFVAALTFFSGERANGDHHGGSATDGAQAASEIRGSYSPPIDLVRVLRGPVAVTTTAARYQGVAVGIASFDRVRASLVVQNGLDCALKKVEVELALQKELPAGDARPLPVLDENGAAPDDDPELGDTAASVAPLAGWRFHITAPLIDAGATAALPTRDFTLPPLPSGDHVSTLAELSFVAEVSSYVPVGLSLARALEMVNGPSAIDQKAAIEGYGEGLSEERQKGDERLLLEKMRAGPLKGPPRQKGLAPTVAPPCERDLIERAALRIGGAAVLDLMLTDEDRLSGERAARRSRNEDGAASARFSDELSGELTGAPPAVAAALHEVLVDVARRNLATLYSLVHAPPSVRRDSPRLVEAADRLAVEEGWDSAEAWLDATSVPDRAPERPPLMQAVARAALAVAVARLGGADGLDALVQAFEGVDDKLRRVAAMGLAARGLAGLTTLVRALDTDDEARRALLVEALSSVDAEGLVFLRRVAADRSYRPTVDPGTRSDGAAAFATAIDGFFQAKRRRSVEDLIGEAERAAISADPQHAALAEKLLERARSVSPRYYRGALEHVARAATSIYLTRRSAHEPGARSILDGVRALGTVNDQGYAGALRTARIDEARALGATDVEAAVRVLSDGGERPVDAEALAEASTLLLRAVDEALDERRLSRAERLMATAHRSGVSDGNLGPRSERLRSIRTVLRASAAVGVGFALGFGFLLFRLRRRRARVDAAPLAPRAPRRRAQTNRRRKNR